MVESLKKQKQETQTKGIIYAANYAAGFFGNLADVTLRGPLAEVTGNALEKVIGIKSNIGNPIGAIFYGGLEVVRNIWPEINGSLPVKALDNLGALYYSISAVLDLCGGLKGEWGSLVQLPFDLGMAYVLLKSAHEDFKSNVEDKEQKKF